MEIECEFCFNGGDNGYICRVLKQDVPGPVIKSFKGQHLPNKSNVDVLGVRFFVSNHKYFPRDLQKHFPNIERLEFLNGGRLTNEISKRDLIGLENLTTLRMVFCQLTSLPDDLFTNMPNLVSVSFFNNQIESASSNLLKPFVGRSEVCVDLRGNRNIDAWYNSKDLVRSTHKSLEELMKEIDVKCSKPIKPQKIEEAEECVQGITNLWITGQFSDFKIVSGEEEFKVHRNILAMRSSVMADIFEKNEDAKEIKINYYRTTAVEALLHFMYSIKVPNIRSPTEELAIAQNFEVRKVESAYEEDFTSLWMTGKFSDFTIISGDEEFRVHRNILAARSSTMAEIFDRDKEATEIKIKNFTQHAVTSLLYFIYINKIPNESNAHENLVIAHEFRVSRMKSAYEEIISRKLDDNNAYETCLFADQYEAENLKQKAINKMIGDKFPDPLRKKLMKDPTKLKKFIENRREIDKLKN